MVDAYHMDQEDGAGRDHRIQEALMALVEIHNGAGLFGSISPRLCHLELVTLPLWTQYLPQ